MGVLDAYSPSAPQAVFFDDNITYDLPRIVDVRFAACLDKVISLEYLTACHVVRAEPLESVTDRNYFIRHVQRLVAAYDRRLAIRDRLRSLLWRAVKTGQFASVPRLPPLSNRQ